MRRAHLVLIVLVAIHIPFTFISELTFWRYTPDASPPGWLPLLGPAYCVTVLGLIFFWYWIDAKERGVSLPFGASTLVLLLFPVGVLYYYVRTYPTRGAILRIGLAGLFVAVCLGAEWLGQYLANYYFWVWTDPPTIS